MDNNIFIRPKRYSLVVFFVLAFVLTWAAWVPTALASRGILGFTLPSALSTVLGLFGPPLAAILTAALMDGRQALGAMLRRLGIWRVGFRWYLFVFFWWAVLSLVVTVLSVLLGSPAPDFAEPSIFELMPLPEEARAGGPWIVLPFVFVFYFLTNGIGEEIGWRGYALPRLQGRWGALMASVILGLIWGLWHLPLFLTVGDVRESMPFGWYLVGITLDAVLYTFVFNNARGSLLLVSLFHTTGAVTNLFLASVEAHPVLKPLISLLVVAMVVYRQGPDTLSRQLTRPEPIPEA